MTKATYKSSRLLVEAVNREMEAVRKAAMGNMALGSLNELRDLVAQLAARAERTAVDDVQDLPPDKFVATMKPLVANYHRILAVHDLLANCLCEDLRLPACVLIMVGDDKSVVRAAHDQNRPDMPLIVETIISALESGTRKVATEAAQATEAMSGQPGDVQLCSGCDCVAGECNCEDCEENNFVKAIEKLEGIDLEDVDGEGE